MAATVKAKVIGPFEVGGVAPGGTVLLDPELVRIDALVQGGHIELIADPPPAPSSPAQTT